MLSVRYGPFHSLEEAFVSRLKELIAQGQPAQVAVVAPSRRLADRLERLAAVEHGLCLLGVEFHTFHSLAAAIVEETGFPDLRLISDPVFHDRLVDRILDEKPQLAGFFGGPARPRALAGALRASLRDLIDAGVSPGAVEEHFGEALVREPREREQLGALLALARAYEERLAALRLMSSSDLVKLAAERAADSKLLGGCREVLYYGFYDLTGLQLDFFEAVVSRGPAMVFFPYRPQHPAFRFAEDFFDQKLRGREKVEVKGGKKPALEPALDRLFGPGAAEVPENALSVVAASGARDEAWAAAKEILRLVEAEGLAYDEIGVVARTLEPYRSVVAEVFAENAIPCDMGSPEPLLRRPLAKGALNLLRLRQADFPAAVIEDLFGSPYFRPRPAPARLRHWRRAIRTLGIRAGWLQWRGKLETRAEEDFVLAEARDARERRVIPRADMAALWDWLSALEAELAKPAASWTVLSQRAREILERNFGPAEDAEPAEAEVWELVKQALESLALFDLLGSAPSWEEFLECLEDKLRRAALKGEGKGRGVRVLGAMDARGESFRALIAIGLKEKLFPRLVQEDPLLREAARAALRHPAGYWIARKASGYEEERLLFYLTAAAAQERLVCVYPRSDEAGKAEVPSLYLRELCRSARIKLGDATRVPRQPAEKLRACPARLLSAPEFRLLRALDGALPPEQARRVADLNRLGPPAEFDGLVGPPEDYLKKLRREGLSPSALDALARCPFQYFADRVLGLGAADEGAEKGEFAAWARGKIYHAVLERFYARPEPADKRLEEAVEAVFAEYDWRKMGVYPLLWLAAKQAMTACLREFVAWDLAEQKSSGLSPRWLEKELSGDWPAEPPAALAGLRLKGVIDRVDVGNGRFRIVDYKSRWRRRGKLPKLIADGELHQLPLYVELAGRELGGRTALAEAAIYSLEDSPEKTGFERSHSYAAAQWQAEREGFFAQVAERLERIARGEFPISPDDGDFGHCRYCGFSALCRKSHGPTRRRAMIA